MSQEMKRGPVVKQTSPPKKPPWFTNSLLVNLS